MLRKTRRKRSLKPGFGLMVLQNPTQNPDEPGIIRIQAGAFTFRYLTIFGEDGRPCKPWVGEPTWTYESDRLSEEVMEALRFIEPEARILAKSVVTDHKARAEKKAKKEALNPRLPGWD